MRIGMRLLLGYFLIVAIAAWFVLSIFVQEVKPGVRRATEGTLIDTATLLAEVGRDDVLSGNAQQGKLAQAFSLLHQHPFRASIGGIQKVRNEYHVYMTDAQGRVVFDSAGLAVGQDYSRWNDVWLTLRGEYGARSTQSHPDDPESTVMYVAAPVVEQGKIIGVLSVGKPNSAMAPVIHRSERRILWAGGALLGIALLIGLLVAWWINRSISTLSRYADSVTTDTPLPLPNPGSSELHKLAQALENMRIRLEGKNYIERYVHALTHELKSPIAAIRGAAEILSEQPPPQVAARFIDNILVQNARMQLLVEKLLTQARLENRVEITPEVIRVNSLFTRLADARSALLSAKAIVLTIQPVPFNVEGDPDLLEQALGNLLDNAYNAALRQPAGSKQIECLINSEGGEAIVEIADQGCGIEESLRDRIFERGVTSSDSGDHGIGLWLVRSYVEQAGGNIVVDDNIPFGTIFTLYIPLTRDEHHG